MLFHEVCNKKKSGVLLKVDFEKAYDKVKWPFLYQMMQAKGFGDVWCDWMMRIVRGGRVAVKLNDKICTYFPTYKGIRQGDPLSPLLFDIIVDGHALFVKKAIANGQTEGLASHLVDDGVVIL